LGILMQNTVTCQQNMNTIAQAATAQGVAMIYSVDTAATGLATSKILQDK
jgi:phospholipase C